MFGSKFTICKSLLYCRSITERKSLFPCQSFYHFLPNSTENRALVLIYFYQKSVTVQLSLPDFAPSSSLVATNWQWPLCCSRISRHEMYEGHSLCRTDREKSKTSLSLCNPTDAKCLKKLQNTSDHRRLPPDYL